MKVFIGKEANEFLKKFNLDVASYVIVKNLEDALKKINKFSFPIVIKLISKDAIHKTEINGVIIVKNKEDFKKNFDKILQVAKKNKIRNYYILIQKFVEGLELIIGLKKDQTFGHVVMLGLGGIYVEALKDVTFRVCPINREEAINMINDLKVKDLILSKRKKLNVNELYNILTKVSQIPLKNKDIKELDINPLILSSEAKVVDARIIF